MKIPHFIDVDGYRLPASLDPDTFRAASKYKPQKDQIVIVTYPKCGTTWTAQIVTLILRKGVPPADGEEYFSLSPFMENIPVEMLQNMRKDGCLKTHLPFDRTNFSKDAKYIYMARHPADCVVSFYHHVRYLPIFFYSEGSFDEFFEVFITGETSFGDYFDNLLSWYEHKDEPNVLFLTYEDTKADIRAIVLKIAKFLGDEYYESLIRNDEEVLKKVLEYSSFDYMKETVNKYWNDRYSQIIPGETTKKFSRSKNYAEIFEKAAEDGHHPIGSFIRQGKVGEGKITLSDDQKRRLECRIKEKCAQSVVMNLWKNQC